MASIKILIADNDLKFSSTLSKWLRKKGFQINTFYNREDSIKDFMASPDYNLCLIGADMPAKDGIMLAKAIRDVNSWIPLILITNGSDIATAINAFRFGASDYLTKPIKLPVLGRIIDQYLSAEEIMRSLSSTVRGDLILENDQQMLSNPGKNIRLKLTTDETRVLEVLFNYRNTNISKIFLMKKVWSSTTQVSVGYMANVISSLQSRLAEVQTEFVKLEEVSTTDYRLVIERFSGNN